MVKANEIHRDQMFPWIDRSVQGFSSLTAPMTKLTRKNEKFMWTAKKERVVSKN